MLGYITASLQRFSNPILTKCQDSPFSHTTPNYGAKVQYTKEPDTTKLPNKEGKKFIQRVSETLLYLVHTIYITIITPLSAIVSQQSKPTEIIMKIKLQILDYFAPQEEAVHIYSPSQMTLATHINARYLNELEASS